MRCPRIQVYDTLFHRLALALCHAGRLPRKELFEAWETARRVRRVCRGGRVVDLGGGHGLLAHAMLLLDDSSAEAIDVNDQGDLAGWVDGPLAVDVVRALRLKARGYRIRTQLIAREITAKNRLLIGEPV